jgi:hypothetical protein
VVIVFILDKGRKNGIFYPIICENTELLISMTQWSPVFNELLTLRIPRGLLLCLLFSSTGALGQSADEPSGIATLESSTAIFVLSSSHQKVKTLKEEMANGSARSRARLVKLLHKEQTEVDSFNRALQEAVISNYIFSEYVFLTDTLVSDWVSTVAADKKYFFIRKAKTESGAEALVMFDSNGQRLSRPIPYYAKIFRFSSVIDAFFGQADYSWRDLNQVVARWSERLQKFYK